MDNGTEVDLLSEVLLVEILGILVEILGIGDFVLEVLREGEDLGVK